MKKFLILLTALAALLPGGLSAQAQAPAKAQAILAFYDDDTQLVITDAKGNPMTPSEGMVIPVGAVVKTQKTSAEIQLKPNGTIVKLSAQTAFKIEALKEAGAAGSNDFNLIAGKIRTVAAKITGTSAPGYNVRTQTANCGVRGTDFAMRYDEAAQQDWVCVQEGQVDFTNSTTGATIPVAANQFANTFDATFQPAAVDAAKLASIFSDLDFVKLSPKDVPGKDVPAVTQDKPAETKPAPAADTKTEAAPAAQAASSDSPLMEMLKKIFGMEVGSVTINGTTYSKAVLSPVIAFDKFKLGLYLPIVYTNDMFNANEWYRPAGNNEWSFGTDKTDLLDKAADIGTDLALKIKFLEWGTQGVDPFYLKAGNLSTMSIGHGTVVRNFANDQDFPSVRRIGLNGGAKFGGFALEGLVDDLSDPGVVGGRIGLDLIGNQVALGVQTAADLQLANDQDLVSRNQSAGNYGEPILLVGGLDAQFFQVDLGPVFRTKAFADANTLAVYLRQSSTLMGDQGLNTKTLFHDGSLGSLGGEAGFLGNIAIVDYRLSFQMTRGLYTNGIFQGNYYRTRTATLDALQAYLAKPNDSNLNMGIFGSFGFDLLGFLTMDGAYKWPMYLDSSGKVGFNLKDDYLRIKFDIPKDKIPFVKLSGGVSYERTGFVDSLTKGVNLFDANTVLKGEVVYGMTQGMDLVVGVSTATLRDASGNVLYENNQPKVGPTISLDTRLSL
jgi:hypothetical protein